MTPAGNMPPETAQVKLGGAPRQTDDIDDARRIMLTPVAGAITDREPPDGYLVYQSGLAEVEDFLRHVRK